MKELKVKVSKIVKDAGYDIVKLSVKGEVINVTLHTESESDSARKTLRGTINNIIESDGAGSISKFDGLTDSWYQTGYNNTQGITARVNFSCVKWGI